MKKYIPSISIAFLFLVFLSVETNAQTKIPVRFARGATSATVRGTVKGYAYKDYVFSARSGQRLAVRLDSKYPSPDVVVRAPDGENLSTGGDWSGELADNGTYTVRVLLPRAFARRGQTAAFKLTIEIE
ncbi:MAG TPA: hypothetical protein VIL74_16910 [Pyrinomonadaceae bacterium]|jgi:hypothetical protein